MKVSGNCVISVESHCRPLASRQSMLWMSTIAWGYVNIQPLYRDVSCLSKFFNVELVAGNCIYPDLGLSSRAIWNQSQLYPFLFPDILDQALVRGPLGRRFTITITLVLQKQVRRNVSSPLYIVRTYRNSPALS